MSLSTTIIETVQEQGMAEIVLPFLFVFLIVYGLLTNIQLFGDENINSGLSIIIALLTIFYSPPTFQSFIINMMGSVVLLIVAFFVFLVLVAASPGKEGEKFGKYDSFEKIRTAFYVVLGIIVIYMFVAYGGLGMIASPGSSGAIGGAANFGSLVGLLVVFGSLGLFMYWLVGGFGGDRWVVQRKEGDEWSRWKSTTDPEKYAKWKDDYDNADDIRIIKK
ncbi:MAG: hypothetical protein MUP58_02500 [Candidatus Nanohaloarchaeota archaeon QJJ-9]|nr:hypothetical protein [Candidatus Nanohaloarchaeota archaeon QJJ-9]